MVVYSKPVAVPPMMPTQFWVHGPGYGYGPYPPSSSSSPPLSHCSSTSPDVVSSSPPHQEAANWTYQQVWFPPAPDFSQFSSALIPNYQGIPVTQCNYENQGFIYPPPMFQPFPVVQYPKEGCSCAQCLDLINYTLFPNNLLSAKGQPYQDLTAADINMVSPAAPIYPMVMIPTATNGVSVESGSPPAAVPELPIGTRELASMSRVRSGRAKKQKKGKMCTFCVKNQETQEYCTSHNLRNTDGTVQCPVLRKYKCPLCGSEGDNAHTIMYCPENKGKASSPVGTGTMKEKPTRNSKGIIGSYKYEMD